MREEKKSRKEKVKWKNEIIIDEITTLDYPPSEWRVKYYSIILKKNKKKQKLLCEKKLKLNKIK